MHIRAVMNIQYTGVLDAVPSNAGCVRELCERVTALEQCP